MSQKREANDSLQPINSFTKENLGKDDVITAFTSPNGRVVKVTGDVDEAMKVALEIDEDIVLDEETNKRLLRKIDMFLLPLICLLYAFQFMDKTTTSYAAVMGFKQDFDMVGDMYSWCGTAFYIGYLAFELSLIHI